MFVNKVFAYLTCTYLKKYKVFSCEIFNILFSYDHENISRFSNLHCCTFKDFYFCTKLCILINSRELISNISIAFQTYCPKCPNKAFLVPNLLFFIVLNNFLNFSKFEDVDFKYNNSFSNLQAKIQK